MNQTTTLAFTDGSAPMQQTGGSAFSLAGIAISATAGAIAASLNAADQSAVTSSGSTKARVFLGAGGDFFDVNSSGATVNGNLGADTLKIHSAVAGVRTDANIERIELPGSLASYKFVVVPGTGVQIQNTGGSVIVTIPSLNQTTTLAFTDGSAPLIQTGGSAFSLGGLAIGSTPGQIGATLLTTDPSTVGVTDGSAAVTINASTASVTDGGADVHTTYTVTTGNYSATIAGFGTGDKLDFFANAAISVVPDGNQTDGMQSINAVNSDTGQIAVITLTGLTAAQDNAIFNMSSFLATFGG